MMKAKISSRRAEIIDKASNANEPSQDLFTRLLEASIKEGNLSLNDGELLGNSFEFLFAGHGKSI